MVAVAELLADVVHGQGVHPPDQVDGHLTGRHDVAAPALAPAAAVETITITDVTPTPEPVPVRPLFACTHERYRWLMHHPDARTDADSAWLRDYRRGEEYADLKDLYAAEGIA